MNRAWFIQIFKWKLLYISIHRILTCFDIFLHRFGFRLSNSEHIVWISLDNDLSSVGARTSFTLRKHSSDKSIYFTVVFSISIVEYSGRCITLHVFLTGLVMYTKSMHVLLSYLQPQSLRQPHPTTLPCVPSRRGAETNFYVFGLTPPGIERGIPSDPLADTDSSLQLFKRVRPLGQGNTASYLLNMLFRFSVCIIISRQKSFVCSIILDSWFLNMNISVMEAGVRDFGQRKPTHDVKICIYLI